MTVCTAAASVPATASGVNLTGRVESSLESLAAMRDQWDELVEATHGDIYFTYDWCRIYWRHYAHGRQLRILLFYDGRALVGIVPLVIERLWVGPLPIRLARLLGSDWTPAVLNPPVLRDYAVAVYRTVIEHSFRICGCDAISFARLSGEWSSADDIRRAAHEAGPQVHIVRDQSKTVHTILHLPATFDAYLAGLSKNERKHYRQGERCLREYGPVTLRCHRKPGEIDTAYGDFVAMHEQQWRPLGKLGHFGDWPQSLGFTRDLLRALAVLGRAEVAAVSVGDVTVAMEITLRCGNTSYWRLPARKTEPHWEKCGIGRVARIRQIEALTATSVARIELGQGRYPHKLRLGGVEYPLHSILVARNSWWPRLKTRLLAACADLLNLLYYRIWFCRLAPRLPLPRRPLWKSWIRTRV